MSVECNSSAHCTESTQSVHVFFMGTTWVRATAAGQWFCTSQCDSSRAVVAHTEARVNIKPPGLVQYIEHSGFHFNSSRYALLVYSSSYSVKPARQREWFSNQEG